MPDIKIASITLKNGVIVYPEYATIKDTMLGIEDHGIMSSFIYLDYANFGTQGFGGWALDGHNKKKRENQSEYHRIGFVGSIVFIRRTLEIAGVREWEKLKGKAVIALRDKEGHFNGGQIIGLMSVSNHDEYFLIEDCFSKDN